MKTAVVNKIFDDLKVLVFRWRDDAHLLHAEHRVGGFEDETLMRCAAELEKILIPGGQGFRE